MAGLSANVEAIAVLFNTLSDAQRGDTPQDYQRLSQEMSGLAVSFEGHRRMGGPSDGTLSTYSNRRFSGLRCGSVQNLSLTGAPNVMV